MDAKAYTIKKQVYFWFDDSCGFIVHQLEKPSDEQGGIYLISAGGIDQVFSFQSLKQVEIYSENDVKINILLANKKNKPPFNVISKYRFDQIISMFKKEFGEK